MKKFISSIAYVAIFFGLFILGCTKDVNIQDQFDYDVNIVMKDSGYVFEGADLALKIIPKRVVKGTTYKLSYVIESGGVYLEAGKTAVNIKKDDLFKMPETNEQVFKFYPTEVGENKILITIEDSNGLKKTKEVVYKAKLAPFTFLLTPNLNAYTINARGAITSTLIRNVEDSFTFSYLVENGTGTLYNGNEAIPLGKPYKVIGGISQLHYVPTTLGTHKLTATVTASDGAQITRTIDLVVDNVPFSLNATSVSTTINVNQEVAINVDLTELQKGITSYYEITHSFDAKGIAGTLKNAGGTAVSAGVFAPITPGTFQYKFKAATQGVSTITFKVKDSNGQIKETSVVITVANVPFTFTGTSTDKTILLNESTKLNFNIVPNTTDSNGVTYSFVYQGEAGDGILTDADGKIIQRGSPVSVNKGVFSLNYKPTSLGSHVINFTVTDNNGEKREAKIEMESVHTPVTFNVSSVTQTYVNQTVGVDFVITPQLKSNLTYEMNYYVSGGQGILKNGDTEIKTGEYKSVSKGGFKYDFTPTIAGNFVLTFELKDSNGQVVSKSVSIIVANNKFTFTPTPSQKVFVNESNVFSYALVPTGNYANTTYNVSYTVEQGQLGTFLNNGVEVQQGIPIAVKPTSFNLSYKPTTLGEHKIHYIVTDSNGLREEVIQTVTVVAANFNFKVQQANTTVYKNNADVILASISQEQINTNIGYSMTYTLTGVGGIFKDGVALPNFGAITTGNHNYTFVSAQSGNTEIVFTVVDTNGISHSQTIKYTTVNGGYTLSTTGDGVVNLGKSKDFSVYLSQLISDPTATYQVRYMLDTGSVGTGKVFNGSTEIPLGEFQNMGVGTASLKFLSTSAGIVNLKVEIKDNNGVVHNSTVIIDVAPINFTFTGAAQNNTIFVNGATSLNFDVTENSTSETSYEIKYSFAAGDGVIKNGAITENANTWYSVGKGAFNRTFVGSSVGDIKMIFTVRNTTTLVEKTQNITVAVSASEFSFMATGTENNQILKTPVNVNLNLSQLGGGVENYSMTFTTSGTGTFAYNGTTYTAGQIIPIAVGASSGSYVGSTAGAHDVSFKVVNQNNVQKVSTVKITYISNDFALSTSGDGTLNLNTTKGFNTFVSQNTTDNAITYQVKYTIDSGTGAGTISKNGTNVPYGIYQNINVGATQLDFLGTGAGNVSLKVDVKDSNGIVHTSTVAFEIKGINYTFSGAPQLNSVVIGGTTPLNFDITEAAASGTTYEMKYVVNSGAGQIKGGANVLNTNTWYPVSVGGFNWNFISSQIGQTDATFTVRNTTTLVEKTQSISVTVTASNFTFDATAIANNQIINTPITVNMNLIQSGNTAVSYGLKFTTSGTGTFVYNGTTYTAGQVIPFVAGSSSGSYVGSTAGAHNISFTASNDQSPIISHSSQVNLTYKLPDFSLSTTGDGSVALNESRNFNVFVSQPSGNPATTYRVRYSYDTGTTGAGDVLNGGSVQPLGQWISSFNLGNTALSFKATSAGTIKVKVEVEDGFGTVHESIVLFQVAQIQFTFTATPVDNSLNLSSSTNVNMNVAESGVGGGSYQMSYSINGSSTGSAEIKYNGVVLGENTFVSVPTGGFFAQYKALTAGVVYITYTVKNNTGVVKSVNLTITNIGSSFSYSASAANTTVEQGSSVNISNTISNIVGSNSFTLSYSLWGSGNLLMNGSSLSPSVDYSISNNAFTTVFEANTIGTHTLSFTVRNSSGVEKQQSITFTVVDATPPTPSFTKISMGEKRKITNTIIDSRVGNRYTFEAYNVFKWEFNRVETATNPITKVEILNGDAGSLYGQVLYSSDAPDATDTNLGVITRTADPYIYTGNYTGISNTPTNVVQSYTHAYCILKITYSNGAVVSSAPTPVTVSCTNLTCL